MSDDITWDTGHSDDITWDDAPKAQGSVGADVIKSGGTGLAKGLIDFAGLPGDAANLLTKGSKAAGDYIGGLFGQEKSPEPTGPILPTSEQIQKGIEAQTGDFYQPQTRAGRFAGTMGEFMGNPSTYLGPGSMLSKAAMGAAAGAGSEAAGQLVEAGGKKFEALDPYARLAGGLGVGSVAGRLGRPSYTSAPTTQEIYDASQNNYRNMKGLGVELHPQVMDNVATNIMTELESEGHFDFLAPKVFRTVERLRDPPGQYSTINDIEGVRKALNKVRAGPDAIERDAAGRAIGHIDDALANLNPADVAINPHYAGRVAQEAQQARANYAAYKQAQEIEGATNRAELQAASTGSGANINNATRQQFKNLLNNPRKMRGISDDVRAQMEQVVRGTYAGDVSRLAGKLAATGIVSAGMGAAIGHALGLHPAVIPAIGYAFKKAGDITTPLAARRASEIRRLNSPLARQTGATLPPPTSGMPSLLAPAIGSAFQNPYP